MKSLFKVVIVYKGIRIFFFIFDPKHTLWVFVRNASVWGFQRVSIMYDLSEIIKAIKIFPMEFSFFSFF